MKTVKHIYKGGAGLVIALCLIGLLTGASTIDAHEKQGELYRSNIPTIPSPAPLPDLSAFILPDDLDQPTIGMTFTVNDLGDAPDADLTDDICDSDALTEGSQCTLRAAIEQANTAPNKDSIEFDVAGDPPFIIDPETLLPIITRSVVIDGTTQPGYVDEPLIHIDAAGLTHGLAVTANDSALVGLRVANATEVSIQLAGSNNTVRRGLILNSGGSEPSSYLSVGIGIQGAENTIGGTGNGDGNVIYGLLIEGESAARNVIQGNQIGAMAVRNAPHTLIGGTMAGAGNNFAGNEGALHLFEARNTKILGNTLFNNFIGLHATNSANTQIGGAAAGAGNEFVNNIMPIWLTADQGKTKIFGNVIRFGESLYMSQAQRPDPAADWHRIYGVWIEGGKSIQIGGKKPGQGNQISGPQDGIEANNVTNLTIQGNSISTYDIIHMENTRGIALITCSDVTIGGSTPGARNVIFNSVTGIAVGNTDGLVIQGNYIGTDETGTTALPNNAGVVIGWSHHVLIGGSIPGAGNLISGNAGNGVFIADSTDIVLQQNLIGTNASGLAPLGNTAAGIYLSATIRVTVGGSEANTRNVISGNGEDGIISIGGSNLTIIGNFIGASSKGASAPGMGNSRYGISIPGNSFFTVIGGSGKMANRIIDNGEAGVRVSDDYRNGYHVSILGNRMSGNGGLGIDLGDTGVTANDPLDLYGPQNFPVINFLKRKGGAAHPKTQIKGSLNSTPSGDFTLHFYSVKTCDPSGYGEADKYLGKKVVQTDENGDASFNVKLPVKLNVGDSVVATATNSGGDTSEFSACFSGNPAPITDTFGGLRR